MDDNIVDVTCDECGRTFSGPENGRGNASGKLKRHMYTHKNVPPDDTKADPPSLRRVIVDAFEPEKTGSEKPPTANEWEGALAKAFSGVSIVAAYSMIEKDPRALTPENEDTLIDYLSVSETDARSLSAPFGRMVHKTKINAKYGRAVVDNIGIIDGMAVVVTLLRHWRTYRRDIKIMTAQIEQQANAPAHPESNNGVARGIDPRALKGEVITGAVNN